MSDEKENKINSLDEIKVGGERPTKPASVPLRTQDPTTVVKLVEVPSLPDEAKLGAVKRIGETTYVHIEGKTWAACRSHEVARFVQEIAGSRVNPKPGSTHYIGGFALRFETG